VYFRGSDFSLMETVNDKNYRQRVYEIVRQIPRGRVMTYGQIAEILGEGYTPRTVGYVMHAADSEGVPWQRVINSQGACSTGRMTMPINLQQQMLEAEGVKFNEKGRCDLSEYRWSPQGSESDHDPQPPLFP
jgi:methylated-DNA-protein-cysteine methyltransferase-like protein